MILSNQSDWLGIASMIEFRERRFLSLLTEKYTGFILK